MHLAIQFVSVEGAPVEKPARIGQELSRARLVGSGRGGRSARDQGIAIALVDHLGSDGARSRYVIEGGPPVPDFAYSPWLTANLTLDRWPAERGAPVAWDNVIVDSPSLGYVVATHQSLRTHIPQTVWTYYWALCDQAPKPARQWLLLVRADVEPENGGCHIEERRLAYGDAFEVADETGMRLIVVPCGKTGAYNMPFAIYGGRGDRISRTVFPLKFSETTGDTAFNIRYDATQRLFTSFVKGRGMGDCGSYYAWHIAEPGSADLLVLEEVRIKEECDAKADGGPATWPLAWKRQ